MTTRAAPMRACLPALCAVFLLLPAATAGAQQALVPARPAQPDWFESNRALDVLRAQQQARPVPGGQGGLGAGEAEQIYRNYMQQIGRPLQDNSPMSGYPSGGFGSGNGLSGFRLPQ